MPTGEAPRPATSPAVCRASPNCSKPAVRRITRSSREIDGRVEFGKDYKGKRRVVITPRRKARSSRIGVHDPEGQAHPGAGRATSSSKGEYAARRQPRDRRTSCAILGVEALANYLVEEIQKVYRLQGVPINDKHIEVDRSADAAEGRSHGAGRHRIPQRRSRWTSARARRRERAGAEARRSEARRRPSPCCSASPRPRCKPQSFISAASFQETTRVLTEAAFLRQVGHRSKASRKTSSSAVSSRPAPASRRTSACRWWSTRRRPPTRRPCHARRPRGARGGRRRVTLKGFSRSETAWSRKRPRRSRSVVLCCGGADLDAPLRA